MKETNKKILGKKENNIFRSLSFGVSLAYIITAVVFVVYAFLLTYTDMTENNIQITVMITTVFSVLVGGIVVSRGAKKNGLLYGMLCGGVYALVMIMLSFCILPDIKITSKMIMILVLSISAGGVGGIIGINSKK